VNYQDKMKKFLVLSIIFLLVGELCLSAQDSISNGKALNFPARKYGISIGNSHEFTGIRINFADKNVKVINGLNITLWQKSRENLNAFVNGVSIGVIPGGGTMRPINIGLLALGAAQNLDGLSFGGFILGSGGNINGLSFSGLYTEGEKGINGLSGSGLFVASNGNINGLEYSGLFIVSEGNINGLAICPAAIWTEKAFRGVALTVGYFNSANLKGFATAGYANTKKTNGVSIALFNRAKELHGIQFGLLNYAGNNPKGLRMLPFINLHLKKNKNSDKLKE
jgi:hypothetical protein